MPKPPDSAVVDQRALERETLRRHARENVEQGAVTGDYVADRDEILRMLDVALATELVCTLRYRRHYFMAQGLRARSVADEFLEHSQQELEHADQIATRITQLGGSPDLDPERLAGRSHAEYRECSSIEEMITENLIAERIAIESYREMIKKIGDKDPTTRRVIESVLATEEEHAEELVSMMPQR